MSSTIDHSGTGEGTPSHLVVLRATMRRVNLVDWRSERRQQRKKNFIAFLIGGAALSAAVFGVLPALVLSSQKADQVERITYLEKESDRADKQIGLIDTLDTSRQALVNRMNVITDLQRSRSVIVHLLDQLVRSTPDGIRLSEVTRQGETMTLMGTTAANSDLSAYMKALDASAWYDDPELSFIRSRSDDSGPGSEFELVVTIRSPDDDKEPIADTTRPEKALRQALAAESTDDRDHDSNDEDATEPARQPALDRQVIAGSDGARLPKSVMGGMPALDAPHTAYDARAKSSPAGASMRSEPDAEMIPGSAVNAESQDSKDEYGQDFLKH